MVITKKEIKYEYFCKAFDLANQIAWNLLSEKEKEEMIQDLTKNKE